MILEILMELRIVKFYYLFNWEFLESAELELLKAFFNIQWEIQLLKIIACLINRLDIKNNIDWWCI